MARIGRGGLAWLLWWVTLSWWWLLLAGEWDHEEWLAAAVAAALGATVGEVCRRCAGIELRVPRELRQLPAALAMVPVDFALLCGALAASVVRRRRPRGRFIHRGALFDAGGLDADRHAYVQRVLHGRPSPSTPRLPFAVENAPAPSWGYGVGSLVIALGGAAFGLWRRRLPGLVRDAAGRWLVPPLDVLKAAHSGIVGDYLLWAAAGTVILGGVWAVVLR